MVFKLKTKPQPMFSERKQRFYDFLIEHPVGVLSTVTPNGDPHGVVIYFDIDKDFTVSFITRTGTRKHDNLKHNDRVMLTVCDPKTQAIVQITGTAHTITDNYKLNGVVQSILQAGLQTSYIELPPITKLEVGQLVGYRIIPKQVRMAVYARPDSGGYADLFESIESFELEEPGQD